MLVYREIMELREYDSDLGDNLFSVITLLNFYIWRLVEYESAWKQVLNEVW